ncbi:unnamed protein product [Caenorhabditis auriculariae]|uniref:protein-serine/threonine phosphatase n=1 Tax=Caenorhabditis auriculariae TaxID=2777116 RepID=A0A8S1HF26_9PELO|nr:unnamed protein product [Caenorhabditis auriculariae]
MFLEFHFHSFRAPATPFLLNVVKYWTDRQRVTRSPSPSLGDESEILDLESSRCSSRNKSMSECYFAVRGAAVILPHSESSPTCSHSAADVEIEGHLQAMTRLLRPHDSITMAVRLQTQVLDHVRYLTIVSAFTESDEKRTLLLGMDYYHQQMTIGVVLPLLWCSRVELVGDGGFAVHGSAQSCSKADNALLFRPTSVQGMWFVFQYLHKELANTKVSTPRLKEPSSVTEHYMSKIVSPSFLCAQWQQSPLEEDEDYGLSADTVRDYSGGEGMVVKENELRRELRQIMQSVDLNVVTSRDLRQALSERVGGVGDEYKDFVDREMLVILGQMEKPSEIFPYLLLGTEWNASNWDELESNNVGFILNMTREVDNFFPQVFKYQKVWVTDEANTQLFESLEYDVGLHQRSQKIGPSLLGALQERHQPELFNGDRLRDEGVRVEPRPSARLREKAAELHYAQQGVHRAAQNVRGSPGGVAPPTPVQRQGPAGAVRLQRL